MLFSPAMESVCKVFALDMIKTLLDFWTLLSLVLSD